MLRFAEVVFGLQPLAAIDRQANAMLGAFNFAQRPTSPLLLGQRTCPAIGHRPQLRWYAAAGLGLGLGAMLLLVALTAWVVRTYPHLSSLISRLSVPVLLGAGLAFLVVAVASTSWLISAWHLPP
jgi:hypothetical protein